MDLLAASMLAALLAGIVIAAGWVNYRLWRAAVSQQRPLFMLRVLAKEGVSPDDCADAGTLTRVAAGARRCLLCREREKCASWLDGRSAIAPDRFCPNADLIARLAAHGRAVSASSR